MLEYSKNVLSKVSFDKALFEKELIKAIKKLVEQELKALKKWCYKKFSNLYSPILDKHFQGVSI